MTNAKHLDLNPQFVRALDLMEHSHQNLFITGKAGTGKSTLLSYFRNTSKKKMVVLAPTGVAALNVQGQTIHSFFHFKPDITVEKINKITINKRKKTLYQQLDTIVIDEISMVRADLLDCIDTFMRRNGSDPHAPFGGVQLIVIGDMYQLPPVVTSNERQIFREIYASPYFFDAKCYTESSFTMIELEKVYRQKDTDFIELLNSIRNNSATDENIDRINARLLSPDKKLDTYAIYLTTTNAQADIINLEQLSVLKGKAYTFFGEIEGDFDERILPNDQELQVKVGAQVMMLNNDSAGRWVNGSMGKISAVHAHVDDTFITVILSDGSVVTVYPNTWQLFRYSFNEESRRIETETTGSYTQFPLMLAWAVTIHKSQGKTFNQVIVDIGRGTFAHGQLYVALSRCTSYEGLLLQKAIAKKHIFMDWRIVKFMTGVQYQQAEQELSQEEKIDMINKAIKNGRNIHLTYLKANDQKSERTVQPHELGFKEYMGKTFLGLSGFDELRGEERMFRIDRILTCNIV